jgi:hypothetical protein
MYIESKFFRPLCALVVIFIIFGSDLPARSAATHVIVENYADEASLKDFLQNYLKKPALSEDKTTRYQFAAVRLKDGDKPQIIVYLTGRRLCGSGGCIALIISHNESAYQVLSKLTLVQLPIRVLSSKAGGWHDLGVWVQGGGIQAGHEAVLSFDGKGYPSNPTAPPARQPTENETGEVIVPATSQGHLLYDQN